MRIQGLVDVDRKQTHSVQQNRVITSNHKHLAIMINCQNHAKRIFWSRPRYTSLISFSKSSLSTLTGLLRIDSKVRAAINERRPVVALESTIVAHGMPYPQNFELAQKVEDILEKKVKMLACCLMHVEATLR